MSIIDEFFSGCKETFECSNEYYLVAVGMIVVGYFGVIYAIKRMQKDMEAME